MNEQPQVLAKGAGRAPAGAAYIVAVGLKPEFIDSDGQAALGLLQAAGACGARDVRVSRLYELSGAFNLGHVQTAVRELLCDCVTQEFRIGAPAAASPNGGLFWRAEVWLKPTVTDTVGESVRSALLELGIPEPVAVRCGLAYHIQGKCGRPQLEKAVARSLANPIIHRFNVSEGR